MKDLSGDALTFTILQQTIPNDRDNAVKRLMTTYCYMENNECMFIITGTIQNIREGLHPRDAMTYAMKQFSELETKGGK